MDLNKSTKFLFFINPRSGKQNVDWEKEIDLFFKDRDYQIELSTLDKNFKKENIQEKIKKSNPDRVVAVGGDGTVNAIAECLLNSSIPLGIVPSGSANGMAKEFDLPVNPQEILEILVSGEIQKIHVLYINDKLCLHLSDVGFNARMIEKFQSQEVRGFWGYLKASFKVARNGWFKNKVHVTMYLDGSKIFLKAGMVVIANGTKYGSGALINPTGNLEDELFEIIVIKKVSIIELFKMMISHSEFNPHKIEVYQTHKLSMKLPRKNHFQIDGEYIGKVTSIEAYIIPEALGFIVPQKILP